MMSEIDYTQLLDQLFEGIYIVDVDRRIIYWNEGAKIITGFERDEVIGKYCHDNILNHVDEFGKNLCLNGCPLHKTLEDGKTREILVYLQHKKGHRIPVKVRSLPLYEKDEIIGSIEIFSENIEKQDTFNKAYGLILDYLKDDLSQLPNRKYVDHFLISKMNDYKNLDLPFGVVMVDIDSFEEFNNTYGKSLCDQVIETLAQTYNNSFRIADLVGRWREDEFIFVFTGIKHEGLKVLAEKIRMISENTGLRGVVFKDIEVTVSVGATLVHKEDTVDVLTQRSYGLMKKSKSKGGNTITVK